jgi:hypothetical protein
MNLPVFLNKWIISNRYLKYTNFWYWFRLINHDDWQMDDHQRYWDFWLNLNQGYLDTEYKWEFKKFWGKGAKVETMYVSAEDYDVLVDRINNPDPKQIESLRKLMNRKAPWDD